ncbi:TPA: efflux RND transporter periplasmic adaptor subunit [Streptococcus suis 92-1191]|uniref:efflux RND transporter periplasmic adaptor subunit n=1 Tax=Streptococcus suis TaxID=1307 RepID=UPI0003FDA1B8|nr:efflux RND transporter periplasmic adaptor subunit [Streptococcus suis]HEM3164041.1 efflux RND transporter periplasmic adaptor subunit [Streptococcus suis 92-1191]
MLKTKKAKIALFSGLSVAAVALIGGALVFGGVLGGSSPTSTEQVATSLTYTVAKEGSIASSTLLTGTISAADEQYVYYDPSKGDLSEVLVEPGTQVEVGTPLIRYDATELQAALDTAVRGRDKIGRQIYDLRNNGQTVQTTGDAATDEAATAAAQRSVDMQLADLNDSYADAQAAVDKAYTALQEATVTSTVAGTVVEVNKSVSKSSTSSQTVVHIVNQGSLQVTGNLTEYDLANIAVDQEVKLTSKVYPDKSWTGKITYISNYPATDQTASAVAGAGAGAGGGSGAKYPFKAALTSELGELKQGFTVNIEVVNTTNHILIPVTAVVPEEDKNYVWTLVDGKAKKVEVTLGNADALNQEVTGGIAAGDQVITIPTPDLEEGKEVEANEEPTY